MMHTQAYMSGALSDRWVLCKQDLDPAPPSHSNMVTFDSTKSHGPKRYAQGQSTDNDNMFKLIGCTIASLVQSSRSTPLLFWTGINCSTKCLQTKLFLFD